MSILNEWVLPGALFSFVLVALIFITQASPNKLPRILLGVAFLILSWFGIMYMIIVTNNLIHYPFLFRVGNPFFYLVPPLFFLYIQCSFFNKKRLSKRDYLHLIPFILAFFDLSKYFFGMSAADKMAEILIIQSHRARSLDLGSGFLPAIAHQYFRVPHSIIYLFFQWKLIAGAYQHCKKRSKLQWIIVLSLAETIMYAGYLLITLAVYRHWGLSMMEGSANVMGALLVLGFSMVSYYLNFKPEFLYDRGFAAPGAALREVVKKEVYVPQLDQCQRLEAYMDSDQPYLIKRLTLNDIALAVQIPVQSLSVLLNAHYMQNFNDFINNYRILHVMKRMQHDKTWMLLTMEGLAGESGFASRTAFYAAFKKKTGLSPGAYAATLNPIVG